MKASIVQFDEINSPDILSIRTKVFVDEQGFEVDVDFDGLDDVATHVLISCHSVSVET